MKLHTLFSEVKTWDDEALDVWRTQRANGLTRYVIYHGILRWGIMSLVVFPLLSHQAITLQSENPHFHLFRTTVIWLVLAVIYGLLSWKYTNESYDEHISHKQIKTSDRP